MDSNRWRTDRIAAGFSAAFIDIADYIHSLALRQSMKLNWLDCLSYCSIVYVLPLSDYYSVTSSVSVTSARNNLDMISGPLKVNFYTKRAVAAEFVHWYDISVVENVDIKQYFQLQLQH